MKKLVPALAIAVLPFYLAVEVYAQQPAPPPSVEQLQEQISDATSQLSLTQQMLANANAQFIAERARGLKINNQLGQVEGQLAKALSDVAAKDKELKAAKEPKPAEPKPVTPAEPEKPADTPKP